MSGFPLDPLAVVRTQHDAVEREMDAETQIDQLKNDPEDLTPEEVESEIEGYRKEMARQEKIHSTAVNLDDCVLPKLVLVRFCEKEHEQLRAYMEDDDVNGHFILMGEIAQAPGHCMIYSVNSKRIYSMIHTECLEIVPPQCC